MLLFKANFLPGLASGAISLTYRLWDKPRVKPGSMQRCHPIGVLEVGAVTEVTLGSISNADAKRAGFAGHDALVAYLGEFSKAPLEDATTLYRVELRHVGDGDQAPNAKDDDLTEDDVAAITAALAKLDAKTPWTRETMRLIDENQKVAASRLAEKLGRETPPFKADVVKLKKLGLTTSYEVGYSLSPRGLAYVAKAPAKSRAPAAKKPVAKTAKKATSATGKKANVIAKKPTGKKR